MDRVEGRHEEAYKKVASKQAFDFGDDEGEDEEAAPEKSPFEELEDEIQKDVINRVKRRIRDQLKDEPQEAGLVGHKLLLDRLDNVAVLVILIRQQVHVRYDLRRLLDVDQVEDSPDATQPCKQAAGAGE